jgi:hypothetical protein
MLVASVILLTAILAGFVFWFYNKRRVTSLVENIDDKQAIINALTNHVEHAQTSTKVTIETSKKKDGYRRKYNKKNSDGKGKTQNSQNKPPQKKKQKKNVI